MRIAVVGDTHGNMSWVCSDVIPYAEKMGVDRIVQVGDFGFVWPDADYPRNLHKLNRVLDRAGLDLLFLPGNHEDHAKLADIRKTAKRNADGHYIVRPRIAYTGRYSAWTWDDRRFAAVGGAVSIDRDWRVQRQRRSSRGTAIWWASEILTADEHAASLDLGQVDVLFTHDAPSAFPVDGLKPDLDSTANRQRMTDVGRALRPSLWFHGHYHRRVTYPFRHDGGMCEVHCLDCDHSSRLAGVAILDLSAMPQEVPA